MGDVKITVDYGGHGYDTAVPHSECASALNSLIDESVMEIIIKKEPAQNTAGYKAQSSTIILESRPDMREVKWWMWISQSIISVIALIIAILK